MPIVDCVKIDRINKGQPAAKAVSYYTRSQIREYDESLAVAYSTGSVVNLYDFTARNHDIIGVHIWCRKETPDHLRTPEGLVNGAASREKAGGQIFLDLVYTLPKENTFEHNRELLRERLHRDFVDHGHIVLVSFHGPTPSQRRDGMLGCHAHVQVTVRQIGERGQWMPKSRGSHAQELTKKRSYGRIRHGWRDQLNRDFESRGMKERVGRDGDRPSQSTLAGEHFAEDRHDIGIRYDRRYAEWKREQEQERERVQWTATRDMSCRTDSANCGINPSAGPGEPTALADGAAHVADFAQFLAKNINRGVADALLGRENEAERMRRLRKERDDARRCLEMER